VHLRYAATNDANERSRGKVPLKQLRRQMFMIAGHHNQAAQSAVSIIFAHTHTEDEEEEEEEVKYNQYKSYQQ